MKFFIAALIAVVVIGTSESADTSTVDSATLIEVNQINQLPGRETSITTINPNLYLGIGPEIFPGEPAYKNLFGSSSSSGSAGRASSASTICNQACPDDYIPVCGTDGITYRNSCTLGFASCQNPDKGIAKEADGPCK